MMGRLTTQVLDTMHGRPAAGMRIDLWSVPRDDPPPPPGDARQIALLKTVTTNADGRPDAPLLSEGEMRAGTYELVFHVAAYFAALRVAAGDLAFLGRVPVRFQIADASVHYHVPLVVSPWSYSTFRGA